MPVAGAGIEVSDSVRVWVFVRGDVAGPATYESEMRRERRGALFVRDSSTPAAAQQALNERGIAIRMESRLLGAISLNVMPPDLEWLQQQTWAERVVPRRTLRRQSEPVVDLFTGTIASKSGAGPEAGLSEAHLRIIDALNPIARGIDGRGVTIGFLDTMFDEFVHRAFDHHRAERRIVEERDFTGQPQSNFHGLAVASVAAGRDDGNILGPAFGASLVGATTEYVPTETPDEEEFLVAGLEWFESIGVDVVNISLGYTTFDDPRDNYTPEDLDGQTAITTLAVEAASARGVVVVVSAGNEGCSSPDHCWYYVSTPADAPSAITVGAIRPDSTRAAFSSLGPTADGRVKPDVAAPGVNNYVAVRGNLYGRSSGTSFSAPLVAGVVAQMLQVNPDLSPAEVQEIIRATAHQANDPDYELGYGVISARRAVDSALTALRVPLPTTASLREVFPNPFSSRLTLTFDVSNEGFSGDLTIYDALGRLVVRPLQGTLPPGVHTLNIDTSTWASGVYLYRLEGTTLLATGALVRIR